MIPPPEYMSVERYLELERIAEHKSEYVYGTITPRLGAAARHNRVVMATLLELANQVGEGPCEVFSGNQQVAAGQGSLHPDVNACSERAEFADTESEVLLNPVLVLEVTSPITEARVRGDGFKVCQTIRSLKEYLVIASDVASAMLYTRQDDDRWLLRFFDGLAEVVELESIACKLPLARIYRRADLPEPRGFRRAREV